MRHWIAALAFAVAGSALADAGFWEKDLDTALARAKKEGRAVLVKFYCTT